MARAAPWSFLLRWVCYMLFWVVLAGTNPKDLAAGALAAACASGVSLRLMPPGTLSLKPVSAVGLFLRFLWQSVKAGVSVALMALSPSLPLRPGIIRYATDLPEGTRRQAFTTFASLLPGTLPLGGDGAGGIAVHCLDDTQPVARQLAAEEDRLRSAFSREGAA
jgi:multicomponent Na+:H+ antiporter subunit E